MTETNLYSAAVKFLPANLDISYYLEVLFKNPENAWFYPVSDTYDHYTICQELAAAGLIVHKRIPQWSNGSFLGIRHEFYYNKEMKFIF